MVRRIGTVLCLSLLGACGQQGGTVSMMEPVVKQPVWVTTIAPEDRARLDTLPAALTSLGEKLPPRQRAAQAPLVDPAAALELPTLSPGAYHCRAVPAPVTRTRTRTRRLGPDFCNIAGAPDGLAFTKQTGANPAAGYLYLDGNRYVFLGARQAKPGDNSRGYRLDASQDLVGTVERVGNFRWRMAVAGAQPGQVQLYELTPVPIDQQPKG